MKKNYEVALRRYADTPTAKEDEDYITHANDVADNYRDAVRIAKEASLHIGKHIYNDEKQPILACVDIVCYFADSTSDYNILWEENYINGKKDFRYEF